MEYISEEDGGLRKALKENINYLIQFFFLIIQMTETAISVHLRQVLTL